MADQEAGDSFEDVVAASMRKVRDQNGDLVLAVDLSEMEKLEGRFPDMGRRCDVRRGPCACGAWH